MSLQSDLAAAFAEVAATVPVRLGSVTVRGFLDNGGTIVPLAGTDLQRIGTVVHLIKDSLPGLEEQVSVIVGALGAVTADGGTHYRVVTIDPIDDGLVVSCQLGGGR